MSKILLATLLVSVCALTIAAQGGDYHKVEVSAGYSRLVADGIIGDGDIFSDDPAEPLDLGDVSGLYSSPVNIPNGDSLFPQTALVYKGKRRRARLNGFSVSAAYNFSKYIGLKFEVSGHYRSNEVSLGSLITTAGYDPVNRLLLPIQASYPAGTQRALIVLGGGDSDTRQRHYNFLGGVQIKNNSKEKRFKPFGHLLAGVSRQTVEFKEFAQRDISTFGKDRFSNTGFTMAFGGGIDVRLSRRIDLRVIQVDYNPVRIKGQQITEFRQPLTNLGIPDNLSFTNLSAATLYSNHDLRINSRWQNNFRIGVGIVFH